MLSKIFITYLILHTVRSQNPSPCPDILRFESRNSEVDRWYAVVSLTSREDLRGIWLRITLDRPAELLGNVFGEATTNDNQEFLIRSGNYVLQGGTTTPVRFFVKYNAATVIPSVVEINLNGRSICSSSNQPTNIVTTESNNLVQSRPTSHTTSGSRRPITSTNVGNTRPRPSGTATTSNQATLISNNNRPNRPSNGNVNTNNNRPTRPSTNQPSNLNNRPSSSSNNFNTATENYRPVGPNSNTDNEYSGGSNQNGNNFNRPTGFNYGSDRDPDEQDAEDNNSGGSSSSGLSVNSEGDDSFFAGDFSEVVNRPTSSSASRPSINRQQQCGTVVTQPSPLISFGQNTIPGQWPWHAALYHSKGIQLMYTCGGTLISTRHILTAAHCVTKPHTNRAINPQNILVYLGKYNLKKFGSEIQDKEVADIFVHFQYNYTGYYNDIAILRLAEPAQITNFVRPICLWDETDELNEIVGSLGTVVGWGFDQNRKLSTNLMKAQMPIVATSTCIYSNRDFFSQFTSEKSFCAGFRNGTSVCNGDSGGGMVFPKRGTSGSRTVWQIRGLVSVGVALQGQGVCDASQYIVFTDVAKFSDWIQQILTNHL